MKKIITTALLLLSVLSGKAQYTKYIQAVDEYVPAPGQFVNELPLYEEGNTATDMANKCTEALADNKRGVVTLGAYGGYITFHFDHPVANLPGRKDFAVWGNAFYDNAEPAIVMVSVDENQNGLPDDDWYELAGSEYSNPYTLHNYWISYEYNLPQQDISWQDSRDQTGCISRNEYHEQEYFPRWLTDAKYLTFYGTLLPQNAMKLGNMYILEGYDYGYADNWPNNSPDDCGMNIEWAVDGQGNSVQLDHIDFVRCYTGVNQTCGDIGETSSEITGAEDLHLEESIATAIGQVYIGRKIHQKDEIYDLSGRRINGQHLSEGLYIRNGHTVLIRNNK